MAAAVETIPGMHRRDIQFRTGIPFRDLGPIIRTLVQSCHIKLTSNGGFILIPEEKRAAARRRALEE